MSQGGALAIAYALRHPDRVSHLILFGAYGQGALARATTDAERLEAETLVNLIRVGWGKDNRAFRQVFTDLFIPGGTAEQHRWWTDLERMTSTPEAAARTLEELHRIDVTEMAERLKTPTLVLHSRQDARVPFEQGRMLASLIPGARFVALDSANHVLLPGERAWQQFQTEIGEFLRTGISEDFSKTALTPAETEVLRLVADGLDNRTIGRRLSKSEKTVRNQVSAILGKIGAKSRSEAIVYARDGRWQDRETS